MKKTRPVLLLAALWEILRFVLLFLVLISSPKSETSTDREFVFLMLLFGAGGLTLPAGFIALMLNPNKYRGVLNLLRLAKALQLFPALLILSREFAKIGVLTASSYLLYPTLAAALFDTIFLILLMAFRHEGVEEIEGD